VRSLIRISGFGKYIKKIPFSPYFILVFTQGKIFLSYRGRERQLTRS